MHMTRDAVMTEMPAGLAFRRPFAAATGTSTKLGDLIGGQTDNQRPFAAATGTSTADVLLRRALEEIRRRDVELIIAGRLRAEFATLMVYLVGTLCIYSLFTAWLKKVLKLDLAGGPVAHGVSAGCVA